MRRGPWASNTVRKVSIVRPQPPLEPADGKCLASGAASSGGRMFKAPYLCLSGCVGQRRCSPACAPPAQPDSPSLFSSSPWAASGRLEAAPASPGPCGDTYNPSFHSQASPEERWVGRGGQRGVRPRWLCEDRARNMAGEVSNPGWVGWTEKGAGAMAWREPGRADRGVESLKPF